MVGFFMQPDDVAVYFATVKTLALVHFVYFAVKAGVAQRYAQFTHGDRDKLAAFARETVSWTFWPSLAMALVVLALGKPMLMLFGPGFDAGLSAAFPAGFRRCGALRGRTGESLLTMSGNQNICAAVYAADAWRQPCLVDFADTAVRPVGCGYRHDALDDVRGDGAVASPCGASSASSWRSRAGAARRTH